MKNKVRWSTGVFAVAMLLGLMPFATADASTDDPTISFEGAGWGHGVGMSQYGAYGRALEGQTYQEILAAYYTDSQPGWLGVGPVPDPGNILTNVASDRTNTTLTVLDGPAEPHVGMVVTRLTGGDTPPSATLNTNDKITIIDTTPDAGAPGGCQATVTINGVDTDWGVGVCDFTVDLTPGQQIPSQVVQATNCRTANCTFGYGTELLLVDNGSSKRAVKDRIGGCSACPEFPGFDIVVETSLDEYTRGIAEVPFSWPDQALKAQAVAARSYAASFVVSTDPTRVGCFCDARNNSSFQVYAGWLGGWPMSDRWDDAATATAGEILTHQSAPDAGIIRAYYSSSNGGASEWVAEKWVADLPYLISVPDPYSLVAINPFASWTFTRTASAVVDAIWGPSSGYTLTDAAVTATNVSGSAKMVKFTATTPNGSVVHKDLSSASVTSTFGLPSWYFDIDASGLSGSPTTPSPPKGADGVGVQDPDTGIWTLRSPNGTLDTFYYGNPRDIPFIGDWNGNGTQTVGLYRESAGFLFLRNSNTQGIADTEIFYGDPGDIPLAGDWNGDGTDTIGVFRTSTERFYLRNTNTQGIADIDFAFGNAGDVPLAGDWNGDGVDSIGVYRPSTKMVYLADDISDPHADIEFLYNGAAAGDRIVVGDWDGDGDDTIGVFRPSTGVWYLRDTFTQQNANVSFAYGDQGQNPLAGFWAN